MQDPPVTLPGNCRPKGQLLRRGWQSRLALNDHIAAPEHAVRPSLEQPESLSLSVTQFALQSD